MWYRRCVSGQPHEDRRRHVRAQPTVDYEVEVSIVQGIVAERAGVVDVSVAGLGLLLEPQFESKKLGDRVELRIVVPRQPAFEVGAVVRHVTRSIGVWGVEVDRSDANATRFLGQCVSELLERASSR